MDQDNAEQATIIFSKNHKPSLKIKSEDEFL